MEMRCDGLEIGCEGSRFFLEVSFHRGYGVKGCQV